MGEKKIYKFAPYIVFLFFSICIFLKPFGNADELWNYNFARGIANGLKPYADISMIQTPLSAYLSSLFLIVFGKGLLSYRIVGAVLMMVTVSTFYCLCVGISKNKTLAFVSTSFVFAMHFYLWMYNYNYLTILLVLLTMILFQKDLTNGKLIAFIFGLLPLIKQSTGAILLAGFYIICVIEIFIEKKTKKDICLNCLIAILPTLLYVLYLFLSGTFADFWEYAVLGIGQFSHRTSYFTLMFSNPFMFVIALIPWLLYGMAIYDFFKNGYDGKKIKCYIISLASMSIAYPLCDTYHFCSALIPAIPILFMTLKFTDIKRNSAIACNLIATFIIFFSVLNSVVDSREYNLSYLKNYEGIPLANTMQDRICTVDEYITTKSKEGYKVYIADESAAAYTIPLDEYNKNWDMLLVGNLGLNSIEDMTATTEPCLYLVMHDESSLGMQAHYELINYIKENYNLVGEVLYFDVYEKD